MLDSERDNLPIWSGQGDWHEIYTLAVNDPQQQVALWLRYVLSSPAEADPWVELWGVAFNGAGPGKHITIREAFPFEQARLEGDPFAFQIGRAVLTNHGARGRIDDHELRLGWVLDWDPCEEPFRHFPNRGFYDGAFPPTKLLAPNPDLRIRGEVLLNRRRILLTEAPGVQYHQWGSKHALEGGWAHCATFVEDSDVSFEAVALTPRKVGPLEPRLSIFRFVVDGTEYVVNGLLQMLTAKSRYDAGGWFFEVASGDRRFEGTIEAPYGRMVGLVYHDPDGEPAYCYHTQIADMTLRVFAKERGKWQLERELTANGSCALEVLSRAPDADIPLAIEDPIEVGR